MAKLLNGARYMMSILKYLLWLAAVYHRSLQPVSVGRPEGKARRSILCVRACTHTNRAASTCYANRAVLAPAWHSVACFCHAGTSATVFAACRPIFAVHRPISAAAVVLVGLALGIASPTVNLPESLNQQKSSSEDSPTWFDNWLYRKGLSLQLWVMEGICLRRLPPVPVFRKWIKFHLIYYVLSIKLLVNVNCHEPWNSEKGGK